MFRSSVAKTPIWPTVLGIVGVSVLAICAFVLPATIIVATANKETTPAGMFFY